MSNRSGPNGWQPPLPGQPLPRYEMNNETDQENVEGPREFCRDFIWGKCNKGFRCRFRHELDYAEMKKTLKFCHEYQNSSGCGHEHCSYLHASQDEQNLFEATGQLPAVLAQRYANMSATAETIPQIALYIQESLAGPPPPPPPPPLPPLPVPVSAPPVLPANVTAPPTPLSVHILRPPVLQSTVPVAAPGLPIQQPPPPPPPPTVTSSMLVQHAPIFTAPPPGPSSFSIPPQLPLEIPEYNASMPPPSLPNVPKSIALKRHAETENARPTKLRKEEDMKLEETCFECTQNELRIEKLQQQFKTLYAEEEYETLVYKKKFEEYQDRKRILKSLFSSEFFRFVEDSDEDIQEQQIFNLVGQFSQSSNVSGVSTVPKQLLFNLMDYAIGDTRNFDTASPSSSSQTRFDESLIPDLSSLTRKSSPVKIIYNNTNNHSSSAEIWQSMRDILNQLNSSEKSQSSDIRDVDMESSTSSSTSTKCSQYSNKPVEPIASCSRFPPPPVPGPAAPPSLAPPAVVSAPPPYQPYQPTVPSAGFYYPPPFAGPSGPQMASDHQAIQSIRVQVPPTLPPAMPPPHVPAPAVPQPYHYPPGRYPPPYYPRHP